MKPAELLKIVAELDPDKEILCQVVGQDGSAWNCEFKFTPAGKPTSFNSFNLLTVSHPDLKTLNNCDTKLKS